MNAFAQCAKSGLTASCAAILLALPAADSFGASSRSGGERRGPVVVRGRGENRSSASRGEAIATPPPTPAAPAATATPPIALPAPTTPAAEKSEATKGDAAKDSPKGDGAKDSAKGDAKGDTAKGEGSKGEAKGDAKDTAKGDAAKGDTPPSDVARIEVEGRGALAPETALFVEPGESLRIRLIPPDSAEAWSVEAPKPRDGSPVQFTVESEVALEATFNGGELTSAIDNGVVWKAPMDSGWKEIKFRRTVNRRTTGSDNSKSEKKSAIEASIMICVLFPFDATKQEAIQETAIGIYPNPNAPAASSWAASNPALYAAPKWFIQVTPETAKLRISDNFRLGEFSPPDKRGQMHFVAINPRLVTFLESLRLAVQAEYEKPRPVKILRAFMPPIERARLEQASVMYAEFTRYLYGDGAAIIVDGDNDGKMDDLNGDGKVDSQDADTLAAICDEVQNRLKMFGGVGVSRAQKDPNLPDTPYVDVDLRGVKTRW